MPGPNFHENDNVQALGSELSNSAAETYDICIWKWDEN